MATRTSSMLWPATFIVVCGGTLLTLAAWSVARPPTPRHDFPEVRAAPRFSTDGSCLAYPAIVRKPHRDLEYPLFVVESAGRHSIRLPERLRLLDDASCKWLGDSLLAVWAMGRDTRRSTLYLYWVRDDRLVALTVPERILDLALAPHFSVRLATTPDKRGTSVSLHSVSLYEPSRLTPLRKEKTGGAVIAAQFLADASTLWYSVYCQRPARPRVHWELCRLNLDWDHSESLSTFDHPMSFVASPDGLHAGISLATNPHGLAARQLQLFDAATRTSRAVSHVSPHDHMVWSSGEPKRLYYDFDTISWLDLSRPQDVAALPAHEGRLRFVFLDPRDGSIWAVSRDAKRADQLVRLKDDLWQVEIDVGKIAGK